MTENATIQVTETDSTENYRIFESADGDTIVGMYVADEVAEQLGEFAAVTISDEGSEDATAEKKKDTTNYGVYELPPAITGMYVSHDVLDSEETEEGDLEAPESVVLQLAPSDEETFENSLPDAEEQADALVEGDSEDEEEEEASAEEQAEALVGGGSDESDEDEEVEIADEEIGIDE